MPMDDSIQKSTFNFALSVGELSEEFSDISTVIWSSVHTECKSVILGREGYLYHGKQGLTPGGNLVIFHNVIFLKFTKNIQGFTGIEHYAPGVEPWTSAISLSISTTETSWLDHLQHILFIHTNNVILAKLDYHTSEEPVDLFLTTPVVCTRQQ